jgi:hypothetical protein
MKDTWMHGNGKIPERNLPRKVDFGKNTVSSVSYEKEKKPSGIFPNRMICEKP